MNLNQENYELDEGLERFINSYHYQMVSIVMLSDLLEVGYSEIQDLILALRSEGYQVSGFLVSDDEDARNRDEDVLILTDHGAFFWRRNGELSQRVSGPVRYRGIEYGPTYIRYIYDYTTPEEFANWMGIDESEFPEYIRGIEDIQDKHVIGYLTSKSEYADALEPALLLELMIYDDGTFGRGYDGEPLDPSEIVEEIQDYDPYLIHRIEDQIKRDSLNSSKNRSNYNYKKVSKPELLKLANISNKMLSDAIKFISSNGDTVTGFEFTDNSLASSQDEQILILTDKMPYLMKKDGTLLRVDSVKLDSDLDVHGIEDAEDFEDTPDYLHNHPARSYRYHVANSFEISDDLGVDSQEFSEFIRELKAIGYDYEGIVITTDEYAIERDENVVVCTDSGNFFWKKDGSLLEVPVKLFIPEIIASSVSEYQDTVLANDLRIPENRELFLRYYRPSDEETAFTVDYSGHFENADELARAARDYSFIFTDTFKSIFSIVPEKVQKCKDLGLPTWIAVQELQDGTMLPTYHSFITMMPLQIQKLKELG